MTVLEKPLPDRGVVVGFDGSGPALDAVNWAVREASARGTALLLVRAFDWQWPAMGFPQSPTASMFVPDTGQLRARLQSTVDEMANDVRRDWPDLPTVALVVDGHPATVLAAIADETDAQLVATGASGSGAVARALLGSTASELARTTHRPMIVVRGKTTAQSTADGGGPVVLGIDGTSTSARATEFALDYATRHDMPLTVVHAWSQQVLDPMIGLLLTGPDGTAEPLRTASDAIVTTQLERCREQYPNVRIERAEVRGHPTQALLDHAEDAALLVVGSHGRGPLRRTMLGSVSHAVLYHAPCPVAVLRELDEDENTEP